MGWTTFLTCHQLVSMWSGTGQGSCLSQPPSVKPREKREIFFLPQFNFCSLSLPFLSQDEFLHSMIDSGEYLSYRDTNTYRQKWDLALCPQKENHILDAFSIIGVGWLCLWLTWCDINSPFSPSPSPQQPPFYFLSLYIDYSRNLM